MILIDLQKAFGTIDHNILLLKMPWLGFSREVIDWYESYLSSRKFHVNVHDKFSTSVDLRCGFSQGSILGPLLFLLYINHMPEAVDCDCACSPWCPNLNKKFKIKSQTVQNKCLRYCLPLDNRSHIEIKNFEKINWLTVSERFNQYLCSNAFKFFKETFPLYFHDIYRQSRQN